MKAPAYVVLSVNDLASLLREAKAKAKAEGKTGKAIGSSCVVVDSEVHDDTISGCMQFHSVGFLQLTWKLKAERKAREAAARQARSTSKDI